MDPVLNPYAPGAGQRPPELAGRKPEQALFGVMLERLEAGRPERGIILTGLRGVGKTVLLGELRSKAETRGWVVALVEADSNRPFRLLASQALTGSLRKVSLRYRSSARLRSALGVFKAFSLKTAPDGSMSLGIDADPTAGRADSGDLELDLTELLNDLGEAVGDLGVGVLLLIDELQELAKPDIAALAGAAHHANQRGLPVAVTGAGLPNLPRVLTEAKSYAERLFAYRRIGALAGEAAAFALEGPAQEHGVAWHPEALAHTTEASAGYPYFLQAFGKKIWDYALGPDTITAEDATAGVAATQGELDVSFYGSRWERATPAQRSYLQAMASVSGDAEDDPVSSGQVAGRLGRSLSAVGPHRDQLIRKGLIYAPGRGLVAFTVPGMTAFVRRATL